MAAPRLPFLYPNFLRAVRSCEPQTYNSIRKPPPLPSRRKQLHTTRRLAQEAYASRYGHAASSNTLPPPPKPSEPLYPDQTSSKPPKEHKEDPNSNASHEEVHHHIQRDGSETAYSAKDPASEQPPEENLEPLGNKELDIVLSIPSPSQVKGDSHRHPHLEASPYEHHFDTYSLVQTLATENSFKLEQAVTQMKAIRLMLAINLDIAKEGLVSKSDTENEAYLFRAACSELRTTLVATRHSEMLKQRSQRAQLQHESDLLNQKVTQDLMTMREELKGMFNDRKLGLEEEKRKIDGKIQELNYKITVLLNSEARSNVEGLRWVLTRRAALAILSSACMILAALNYSSIKLREKEAAEAKRKKAKEKEKERQRLEGEGKYTVQSREMGTQAGGPAGSYEESLG